MALAAGNAPHLTVHDFNMQVAKQPLLQMNYRSASVAGNAFIPQCEQICCGAHDSNTKAFEFGKFKYAGGDSLSGVQMTMTGQRGVTRFAESSRWRDKRRKDVYREFKHEDRVTSQVEIRSRVK
ncbi:hypothetical protein ACLOJK_003908 [Asimina triloba]